MAELVKNLIVQIFAKQKFFLFTYLLIHLFTYFNLNEEFENINSPKRGLNS